MNIKDLSDEKLLQLHSQALAEIKRREDKKNSWGILDYDAAQCILFNQWWDECENCEWETGNKDCDLCKGAGSVHRKEPLDTFDEEIRENGGEFIWGNGYGGLDEDTIKTLSKGIQLLGGTIFENPMTEGCGEFGLIMFIPKMIREYHKNPPAPACDCDPKFLLNHGCQCDNTQR